MKLRLTILSAAVLTFAACDGEKGTEAKKEGPEISNAGAQAVKETTGNDLEKGKGVVPDTGDNTTPAAGAVTEATALKSTPAMEAFKARIAGLSEYISSLEGKAGSDPGKMAGLLESVVVRAKGISVEGLPEDLKAAYLGYHEAMSRLLQFVKTIPPEERAYAAWELQNADRLHQFGVAASRAKKLLEQTAAKHGVTGLNLGE